MAIYGTIVHKLFFYLWIIKVCVSYNIDVSHVRVLKGPKDSMFGYTSVFQRTHDGIKLVVGAPKGNSDIRNGTGVTFSCDVSGSLRCTKEYTIRNPNHPDIGSESGAWFNDNEMYGSFISQTVNNPLMVCAPRYTDLSFEENLFRFMVGRCLWGDEVIRPLLKQSIRDYFSIDNKIVIYSTGMGQMGLSGDYLPDGSIVLGVPGFMEWRGGFLLLKTINGAAKSFETDMRIPEFSYLGYSLVSGNFIGNGNLCFAAGGPRGKLGKVFLYLYTPNVEKLTVLQELEGNQVGSYFGASLCAVDVNADGVDDLLVGAPFYTDVDESNDNNKKVHVDEGRVTVFLNVRDKDNKLSLQKSAVLKGSNDCNARFGTAITNIGDVNNDGYDDVAIGAPYEDEGRGVVYIYHGGRGGLKPEVKQRIMGRDINDTVTSFGWSISKPEDIDNNKYPDLTVGGYLSDTAVILRTRPVVNTEVTIETDTQLIIRNASACHVELDSDRCFRLKLCVRYSGPSLPRQLNFSFNLSIDTYKEKGRKRIQINSTQGLTNTVSAVITTDAQLGVCKEYQVTSIKERRESDPFTVVRLVARYQLQQPADPSSDIQPISNQDQPHETIKDIAFELTCGDDNLCSSDLVLTVTSRMKNENDDVIRSELKNDIVINATETLELIIDVRNDGEDAFAAVIYVTWAGSVTFQTTEATLKQPVICSDPTDVDLDSRRVECTVIRPVNEGSDFGVIMYFTANHIATDLSSVDFSVTIESRSNETNPVDNVANVTSKVWIDAKTKIDGIADPEQVIILRNDRDKKTLKLLHKYLITNDGPSFLPATDVIVKLPYYMPSSGTDETSGDPFVTSTTVELIQDGASIVKCLSGPEKEAQQQNQTTTEPTRTTISGSRGPTTFFLPTIPPSKLVQGPSSIKEEGKNRVLIMDCVNYVCEEYVCSLQHLTPGGSAIVNVRVSLPARNIPLFEGQDIDHVMYRSKATVKQPTHPLLYQWKVLVSQNISTLIYPTTPYKTSLPNWILIVSIIAGIIVLALIIFICYKLGCLKREKKEKLKQLQRESAFFPPHPDSATNTADDSNIANAEDIDTANAANSVTNTANGSDTNTPTDSSTGCTANDSDTDVTDNASNIASVRTTL